jgi:hypothetical protein
MASHQWNLKNVISDVGTLIIAIVIYAAIPSQIRVPRQSINISFTPRTMPYFITLAIIGLSVIDILLGLKGQGNKTGETASLNGSAASAHNYSGVLIAFFSIALWIVATIYFGFKLATILLVFAIMLVIGNRTWWQLLLLPLLLSFPLDYVLKIVLRVYLPEGIFFE